MYRRVERKTRKIWKGALDDVECVGDDPANSACLSFVKSARTKPGQTVVFSRIVYKSKSRNRIVKKVMPDLRLLPHSVATFDVKRMADGGFKTMVDL